MEILENPYVEKVTVMDSPKVPKKRSPKTSYKDKLAERHSQYSDTINTVEGTLKIKLDEYYAALSGNYAYIDTHTGKTVHARTYKKRMEFAQQKLGEIESELSQGYTDKFQAQSLMRFTRDAYNLAIRDNDYLKSKNTRRLSVASNLRQRLNSLEEKVAVTDIVQQETISSPYSGESKNTVVPIALERKTSSSLLNKLNEIDEKRSKESLSDSSKFKLSSGAPPVWPIPPKKTGFDSDDIWNFLKIGFVAGLAAYTVSLGVQIYNKFYKSSNEPVPIEAPAQIGAIYYTPSPFVTGASPFPQQNVPPVSTPLITENKNLEVEKPRVQETKNMTATPIEQPKYSLMESSRRLPSPGIVQRGYAEDVQKRAHEQERIRKLNEEARQMAIRRAKAAQGKLHPIFSPQTQTKMIQQEEMERERAEKESQRVPILISAKEAAMKIWEKRFKERAEREGRPVVKQVVYAVGKDPEVTVFNQPYREPLVSSEE